MSVIITTNGNYGPFKHTEIKADRVTADNVDYPFTVIGDYSISEDDSLAPVPPPKPLEVPATISRRQGRLMLLAEDKLEMIEATVATSKAMQIEYEANDWEWTNELVQQMLVLCGWDDETARIKWTEAAKL